MAGDETDMAGDDDVFCGPMSMDMSMQGFFSMFDDKPMCVNFLFRTWSLDTRTKFAFACLGSCAMGAAVELLTKNPSLLACKATGEQGIEAAPVGLTKFIAGIIDFTRSE